MSPGNVNGLEQLERDLEVLRDFAVIRLRDGDLLVVTVDHPMTAAAREQLSSELMKIVIHSGKKRVKAVVLDRCNLAVLRGGAE